MTKGQKIGLVVLGTILIGGGIATYIYVKKRKKEEQTETDTPPTTDGRKPVSSNKSMSQSDIESHEATRDLIKQLDKAYYAMELLENKNGIVYNKKTGKPVASGLDQGTWIQLKKRKNELKSQLIASGAPQPVKNYGESLISNFNRKVDEIFYPKKYHTNTAWYQGYIQKYPEGIKGTA